MLRVSQEISANDEMCHGGNREHYFAVGRRAERTIRLSLSAAAAPSSKSILDLPCGHGRVMRVLRAMFPNASITGCDINHDGVDFCASAFNAEPLYSVPEIEAIPLNGPYDLIWCGSLFTHFDPKEWPRWLWLFHKHLSHNGVAVITLHGRHAASKLRNGWSKLDDQRRADLLRQYDETGTGYVDYAHANGYGFSLATPSRSFEIVTNLPFRMALYMEQGWGTQDAIAITPQA